MQCFVPRERRSNDPRAALTPDTAARLARLGIAVRVERALGVQSQYPDDAYVSAGATIVDDPAAALPEADLHLRVNPPEPEEVATMKRGAVLVGMLDPFFDPARVAGLASAGITAFSLEMLPRTTLAQKMDVLSSQANLAGYAAVLLAANTIKSVLPMMMTPAGTINPCRVFVIGVGVAGLQAIATAKRLGARVEAFDTRPVVEEQVRSLGARFVKIDLGETGQTEQGYARELTPEQLERQRAGMARVCADADIVITTARLFGRKAPTLVTAAMVEAMKPGSVIVDLAAETGGNVEGTKPGEDIVTPNGVTIIGRTCLEGRVAHHATQVYAANLASFVEHCWNPSEQALRIDPADELQRGCLLTHGGRIVHERFVPRG